jgi:hypothetical protein
MMLNPCRLCGSIAWEQTRGQLVEQPDNLRRLGVPPGPLEKGWVPWTSENVFTSTGPATAPDMRIICSVCDNSTGWMKAETADYMRFCWNRDNPVQEHPVTPPSASPVAAPVPDPVETGRDDYASTPAHAPGGGW